MFTLLENNILPILNTLYNAWGWLGVALMLILENATGITPSEVILGLAGWMLVANNQANPTVDLFGRIIRCHRQSDWCLHHLLGLPPGRPTGSEEANPLAAY